MVLFASYWQSLDGLRDDAFERPNQKIVTVSSHCPGGGRESLSSIHLIIFASIVYLSLSRGMERMISRPIREVNIIAKVSSIMPKNDCSHIFHILTEKMLTRNFEKCSKEFEHDRIG